MEITCPACNRTMNSKADVRGKKVKCSCGQAFTVPGARSTGASAAAGGSDKISFHCDQCNRPLKVPKASAGKRAKCKCGQVLTIPTASTAKSGGQSASPAQASFGAISDDEWENIRSQAMPEEPDPLEEEEPKKKSAAEEIMDRAALELGETKDQKKDAAAKAIWSARWLLIIIGVLNAGFWTVVLVMFETLATPIINELNSAAIEGGEELDLNFLKNVFRVFIGVYLGIGVLYIVLGILIFKFPLTCTITALTLFVVLEVVGFIIAPVELLSISGWIRRLFFGGGLIGAVNSASYYNYLNKKKTKGRK